MLPVPGLPCGVPEDARAARICTEFRFCVLHDIQTVEGAGDFRWAGAGRQVDDVPEV